MSGLKYIDMNIVWDHQYLAEANEWWSKTAEDSGLTEEELRDKMAELYKLCTSDEGWEPVGPPSPILTADGWIFPEEVE